MENRIYEALIKRGLTNTEASREAFNYIEGYREGVVEPETMMAFGITEEELKGMRR